MDNAAYVSLSRDASFVHQALELRVPRRELCEAFPDFSLRTIERAISYLKARGYKEAVTAERPSAGTSSQESAPVEFLDKNVSKFNWREAMDAVQHMQAVKSAASESQDAARIRIGTDRPITLLPISDWHFGSFGTDYDAVRRWTDWILETPDLYLALVGDMTQMAIKLRNVLEISDNALTPDLQMRFLESWLGDVVHKVVFATWDNHSVMREEQVTGLSQYKNILSSKVVYHNGIGHPDLIVGEETYRIAVSHKFRGSSLLNPLHGPMRYMRHEAPDREICIQGDLHKPAVAQYPEGGSLRVAINCGTLQTNSGYAKRFFSLRTCPAFPGVVLHPNTHSMDLRWVQLTS